MQVTAAYLRSGAMIRMGAYGSARRLLEELEQEVERLAPEASLSTAQLAVQGAILLKLAILEARDGRPDQAAQRLAEARAAAGILGGDSTAYEMSFGPTNVRIHEVAALIDAGDTEQAVARLREWGRSRTVRSGSCRATLRRSGRATTTSTSRRRAWPRATGPGRSRTWRPPGASRPCTRGSTRPRAAPRLHWSGWTGTRTIRWQASLGGLGSDGLSSDSGNNHAHKVWAQPTSQ